MPTERRPTLSLKALTKVIEQTGDDKAKAQLARIVNIRDQIVGDVESIRASCNTMRHHLELETDPTKKDIIATRLSHYENWLVELERIGT